ncbi:5'-3' exoribonuclease-like isoform X2 [Salvia splendens]|uniref:5'-3' exoribonuclease-like isoform X2 n=1 Tax=Salvia splendens TaxID=180675 RepID=UPI001C278E90|nr:5'-3' exoribonuclease-like isoform X2 [Salvia splendens]
MGDKEKKKKKRGGAKRNMEVEQRVAYKAVREWVFLEQSNSCGNSMDTCVVDDDFGVQCYQPKEKLVFEFHCHTTCSDGFLSPTKLVERAHHRGLLCLLCLKESHNTEIPWAEIHQVKVLALTDHDTMSGIPEAMEAAHRLGIKIIPGVEISTIFYSRGDSGVQESVHILAYYSSCGPTNSAALEKFLGDIRDGRFLRAKNIISKLNKLKLPIRWETVTNIAGKGVAPGRLHIARAMLEAGHVENLKQAFASYLHDDGPAYSTGSEPIAEDAVRFIRETGGVAVLAHPWTLKNPSAIVRRLKDAGLHGIEVYRSDGKLSEYSDLADTHDLLKLGGSDYHGRGGHQESDVGSTSVPIMVVQEFLKVARPIWSNAIQEILENYIKDPSDSNLQGIVKFGKMAISKTSLSLGSASDLINQCLASWLSKEERENSKFEAIKLELEANAETGRC